MYKFQSLFLSTNDIFEASDERFFLKKTFVLKPAHIPRIRDSDNDIIPVIFALLALK